MAVHKSRPIWNGIFLSLELLCIPLVLWWIPYSHLPEPGWAVAFIAGAAAAMSVHDEMKGWQKCIWLLVIGAFLITELRAIHKDRLDNDAKALVDRQGQDLAFKGVRSVQDADFKATADGLTAAITGIKSTLTTANTTFLQTQPHATLRLDTYEFYPSAPSELKANSSYQINYHYINGGTATAINTIRMAALYLADADDKDSQLKLVQRFNSEWKAKNIKVGSVVVPNTPLFDSIHRTFTDDEMRDFNPKKTVYLLIRFEYSDETGRWRTDSCEAYQRTSPTEINIGVTHPCLTFEASRYAVKQPQ